MNNVQRATTQSRCFLHKGYDKIKYKKGIEMSINPLLNTRAFEVNEFKAFQNISRLITFKKGEKIFRQNEPSTHIIIVIQGFVQLSKMINSKNIPVRHISPMQLIGESVHANDNRYPLSAHFITDGIAIIMEYKVCKQMLLWSPNIAMAMFNLVNKSQQYLFAEMENQRLLNTTQRVALFLLEHKPLLPKLMHKEMAMILSLTPETFSRQITKLKEERCLEIKEGKMILYQASLKKLL